MSHSYQCKGLDLNVGVDTRHIFVPEALLEHKPEENFVPAVVRETLEGHGSRTEYLEGRSSSRKYRTF